MRSIWAVHGVGGAELGPPRLLGELHGEARLQPLPRALLVYRRDHEAARGEWLSVGFDGRLIARYDLPVPAAWWLDHDALHASVPGEARLLTAAVPPSGDGIGAVHEQPMHGAGLVAPHPAGVISANLEQGWLRVALHDADGSAMADLALDVGAGELQQLLAVPFSPQRVAMLSAHPTRFTVVDVTTDGSPWRVGSLLLQEPLRPLRGAARRDLLALPDGFVVAARRRVLRLRLEEPRAGTSEAIALSLDPTFDGDDLRGPLALLP